MTHHHRPTPTAAPAGRRLALAVVAVSLLAACTGTEPGDGQGRAGRTDAPGTTVTRFTRVPPTTTGVPPSRRSPEAPPPTTGPPLATKRKPEVTELTIPNRELMKLRGRIVDGVEPGCLILNAEDGTGTWLLIGPQNGPLHRGRVQVTGYPVAGLASTCQQGRPFRVVSITAL